MLWLILLFNKGNIYNYYLYKETGYHSDDGDYHGDDDNDVNNRKIGSSTSMTSKGMSFS